MSPQQARLPGLPGNPHSAQAQHDRALAGGAAEAFVDQLHQACALARVAWVQRVSSHIKITRDLGRGRVEGRLTGKSVVDAVGVLAGGRGVAIEIKHVAVERLKSGGEAAWRLPLARLEEHQASMLATFDQAGGLALVLVIHAGQAFAVPWPVVAAALTAGAASLSAEQLAPPPLPPGAPLPRSLPLERFAMSWSRLDCMMVLGPALDAAGAEKGVGRAFALELLVCAEAYVTQHLTDGFIGVGSLRRLSSHVSPAKVAAALELHGLLVAAPGGWTVAGYLDRNPSRADVEAKRSAEAAKKAKSRGDNPGESPAVSPGESPRESPRESRRVSPGVSPGESPPPSLSDSPTPGHGAHAQTPAENPPKPPEVGGVGGGALGGTPAGTPPGTSAGTPAGTTRWTPPQAPAGTPAGSPPSGPRPSDQQARRLDAFREGVSAATGKGWKPVPRLAVAYAEALDAAIEAHAGDLAGPDLRAWVVDRARAFALAHQGREQIVPGFAPEFFLKWLNAGAVAPASPSSGAPARSRPVQQGRAGGGSFNPFANDPPETDPEVAHAS